MSNQVLLYHMATTFPGDVNRSVVAGIITEVITPLGTTGHPTAYGTAVTIDAVTGLVRKLTASDDPAYVAGILVRPYVAIGSTDGQGTSTPPVSGPVDIMRSGYIGVALSGDVAATRNAPVYLWTAAASGTHIVGGFEADPGTTGQTIPLNARFMGPADAGGSVEIAFRAWPVPPSVTSYKETGARLAGAGGVAVVTSP